MQNNSFTQNVLDGFNNNRSKRFKQAYRSVNLSWLKIKILKHLPLGKIHNHNLFGRKVFFYSGPEFLHSMKEIFIEEIYKQALPDKPYIIDCGANIGLSVIYIKQLYPNATIKAFEPDDMNYDLLSKNINSFGYKDVSLKKEAVWINDGFLDFSSDGTMGSKIESTGHSVNTKKVKAIRLKEEITKKIDFLKLDIEGAEFAVIKDIKDNLHNVRNLFLEYHGNFSQNNELVELLTIVHETGFKFYIKEAANVYSNPFITKNKKKDIVYDIQLNIFCFRN